MITQTICGIAVSLFGDQDPRLEQLCMAAEAYARALLRKGVTPEDCADVFCCAAAMLAVSQLHAAQSGGLSSFHAGTLNVSFGARSDSLSRSALQMLTPWCGEQAAFRGVRA